jgi:nucleotide-binding universal stress UspA family protein
MTSTWIVGVDGSDNSLHALEWAIDQAIGRAVRLVLLASWGAPVVTTGLFPEGVFMPDWYGLEQELARSTEALASARARDGVEIEARVAQGPAAQLLIEASRQSDLLVVGARGLGRVKGLVLGSVSQRCASHSSVPTAIISGNAPLGPVRRAVVGFDGSPNARSAVDWALGFAGDRVAMSVVDALAVAPWLHPDDARRRFPDEVEAAEKEFRENMAELDPGGRADHSFVLGDPRVALARAAHEADLLVMGRRGRGAIGAFLIGSTTTWMLHNAACATVVVPSPS